jgi:hypothetical protein
MQVMPLSGVMKVSVVIPVFNRPRPLEQAIASVLGQSKQVFEMIERSLFQDLGGFDPSCRVCEDYELWLRLTLPESVGLVEEGPLLERRAGQTDQLSVITPAMDRFRVTALQGLLRSAKLSPSQSRLVLDAIAEKAGMLARGAARHYPGEVEHFAEIARRSRRAGEMVKC